MVGRQRASFAFSSLNCSSPRHVTHGDITFRNAKPRCSIARDHQIDEGLRVSREAAADPGRAEGDRELARVDGRLRIAPVRGLGLVAGRRRGRGLALRQAVDLVVHHEVRDVEVAARGVEEVVAADRDAVAVAADRDDVELRPRELDTARERERAAVDAVEAERRRRSRAGARSSRFRRRRPCPTAELQLAIARWSEAGRRSRRSPRTRRASDPTCSRPAGRAGSSRVVLMAVAHAATSFRAPVSGRALSRSPRATSAAVRSLPPERLKTCVRPGGRSRNVRRYL